MNQSEKSNRVVLFRRALYAVLCVAILLFVVESRTQAQSLMTRHVREANLNGQAKFVGRLPAGQSMRIDVVLPLRNQADWTTSYEISTILPAPPTGTSSPCKNLPPSLVLARKITTL